MRNLVPGLPALVGRDLGHPNLAGHTLPPQQKSTSVLWLLRMERALNFHCPTAGQETFIKRREECYVLGVRTENQSPVVTSTGTCECVLWVRQQNCGEKSFYLFLCLFFWKCHGLQSCPVVGLSLSEGCS